MIRFELCSRCCATFLKWSDSGGILKYVRYFLGESKSSPSALWLFSAIFWLCVLSSLIAFSWYIPGCLAVVVLEASCLWRFVSYHPHIYTYLIALKRPGAFAYSSKWYKPNPGIQKLSCSGLWLDLPTKLAQVHWHTKYSRDFACACWTSTLVQQHYPKKWRPVLLLCCCPKIKPNPWLYSWWEANLGTRASSFTKKPPEKYSGKE